jgi:hypothetical protein
MNFKAFLLLSLVFLYLPISSQTNINITGNGTYNLTAPGTYNIIMPANTTATLAVSAWGSGGGSNGGSSGGRAGGGGGGYAGYTFTGVGSGSYPCQVGVGGDQGGTNTALQPSTMTIGAITITASGGTRGQGATIGLGGTGSIVPVGTLPFTSFTGGNGGTRSSLAGGGGGGGAGNSANGSVGGNASGSTGGAAGAGGISGGGPGGVGQNELGGPANAGTAPGGGAGGLGNGGSGTGGSGGNGQVTIVVTNFCPTFTGLTPNNVTITNSTCTLPTCTPSGGVINAANNNCPSGSTLQYRVTIGGTPGAWSTTVPVYDQDGPAQTIETRCNCDTDNTMSSNISSPMVTAPGPCPTGCTSGTLNTPSTFVGGPTATFTISTGITGTWSVNGGGTIDPATGIFTPSAPGCFTATFTPTSGSPIVQDFAVFPAAPAAPVVANTCNSALIVPVLPVVAGFTAQYSFNGVWGTSNSSPTTPGCYTIQTCYIINTTCGTVLAGTQGPLSPISAGVIFPAAPAAPVVANTCNSAIVVPALPAVAGFTAQYSFNGVWGASSSSPTTPGCYTILTRYVTSAACGSVAASSTAPAACLASPVANAVIFPQAPTLAAITPRCNTNITIPAITNTPGFTRQYSFDNGMTWGTSNMSTFSTPGCYSVKDIY